MKKVISVIAPMYNEESLVREYCETTFRALEVLQEKYQIEIILVNDGSKDQTWNYMLKLQENYPFNISTVSLSRNFGLEGAVYAGLQVSKGDLTVVMDADLQDPPHVIINMVEQYEKGADIVLAKRKKRSNDNYFKRTSAKWYYILLDELSGKIRLERDVANFRLLSREALNKLLNLPEVNPVFRVTVPFLGMKTAVVEYERDKRFAGETKYNLKSMIRYALDSVTGISIEPLRKLMILGFGSGLICVLFLILTIISKDAWKTSFFISLVISMFFCVMFFALALVGEYIGQILLEVKRRPTSIIYEYNPRKEPRKESIDEIC